MSELTQQSDRLDRRVWKIVLVAALGSFLAQLDATAVNVSLASLAIDLHGTLPVIQWVTSGYLLSIPIYLVSFMRALLLVDVDTNDQNLLQAGALL